MNKQILVTNDYEKFKKLLGNRSVTNQRVNAIINSIQKVGYITSPIIVNERMEVIDGQGRLEALKRLNLPVEYIVHTGIGIKECISMNVHQTNWRDIDYIKSHADNKNENYIKLLNLINDYPQFGLGVMATAIKNTSRFYSQDIQEGNFIFTDTEYMEAKTKLEYLKRYDEIFKIAAGRKNVLEQSIIYCYTMPEVDKETLFIKIKNNIEKMLTYDTILTCMGAIEKIYNKGNRGNFVYVQTLYRIIARENEARNVKRMNSAKEEQENG